MSAIVDVLNITVFMNHVILNGGANNTVTLYRPSNIGVSQWYDYWERVMQIKV